MSMLKKLPLAIFVSAVAQGAVAETQLDTKVVTATRMQEDVGSIPQSVLVIEGEKLEQQLKAGQSVEQILATMVPGMGPADNSMTNFYQKIRGRQALILIDGVAQRSTRNVSRQFSTIHPNNIERIEVISGASSVYGAGATGGIINIITKDAGKELRMNTTVQLKQYEGGNDDSLVYGVSQSVEGGNDVLSGGAYLNYEKTGVFIDSDGDHIAPDRNQVASDDAETIDLLLKGSFKIDADKQISATAAYFNQEKDSDYAPGFSEDTYKLAVSGLTLDTNVPDSWVTPVGDSGFQPYAKKGLNLSDQPKNERKAFTVDFQDQDFFGHRLLAQTEYRESQYRYFPYPSSNLLYDFDWNGVVNSVLGGADTTTALVMNLNGLETSINQSTIETEIWDSKIVLTTPTFNTPLGGLSLTYGLDYTQDTGRQTATEYDFGTLRDSGYTDYEKTGNEYQAGPESTTTSTAAYVQSELTVNDALTLRAGLRYEQAEVDVESFINDTDMQAAAFYDSVASEPAVQAYAAQLGVTPAQLIGSIYGPLSFDPENPLATTSTSTLVEHESGTETYDAWLANAGAVYQVRPNHQVFVNYSQGYTVPDLSRLLRSVVYTTGAGSEADVYGNINVDATKTYSTELGWRGFGSRWNAFASVYQNESDQTVLFDRVTGIVNIASQKERFWGVETGVNFDITPEIETGVAYAFTRGESEGEEGWYNLGVDRVAPTKWTTFVGYNQAGQYNVRLQTQTLLNYSKGHDEAPLNADGDSTADQVVPFKGYTLVDLMGSVNLPVGEVGLSVSNLMNENYMPLYNQVRGFPSTGASSWLAGTGRMYALSYSVDY